METIEGSEAMEVFLKIEMSQQRQRLLLILPLYVDHKAGHLNCKDDHTSKSNQTLK